MLRILDEKTRKNEQWDSRHIYRYNAQILTQQNLITELDQKIRIANSEIERRSAPYHHQNQTYEDQLKEFDCQLQICKPWDSKSRVSNSGLQKVKNVGFPNDESLSQQIATISAKYNEQIQTHVTVLPVRSKNIDR